MSTQTQSSAGGVDIRLDKRLFYGCLGVFAFLLAVALIFFVGLRLGGRGQIAAAPASFQQPGISVQPGVQAQAGTSQEVLQEWLGNALVANLYLRQYVAPSGEDQEREKAYQQWIEQQLSTAQIQVYQMPAN